MFGLRRERQEDKLYATKVLEIKKQFRAQIDKTYSFGDTIKGTENKFICIGDDIRFAYCYFDLNKRNIQFMGFSEEKIKIIIDNEKNNSNSRD